MDLRAFRVVIAVADHGGVTRAATALHQSSSSVSHTVVGLEAELGVDLFHRLPKGMALTDAGEVFVAAARRAVHEAEVARRSVDNVRGIVAGQVSVAGVLGVSVLLAELLGEFARLHPEVLVRVLPPVSNHRVVELVRGGACDVGITWSGTALPDDLAQAPGPLDTSVLVVPDGHRLAGRSSVSIRDLRGERMVAPLASSAMRPIFDDLFHRHQAEPVVVAEAETTEMVLELVRVGVGAAVTFRSSAAGVLGRGASAVELEDQVTNGFAFVTRSGQNPTPATAALIDLATNRFTPP